MGVSGGIAAYKAATLCSLLVKSEYDVQVIMTRNAQKFIQPVTFQALTKHHVLLDPFDEPNPSEISHIAVADRADLLLVAPATANVIAKLAHGMADDMLTTTALATKCPVVIAPAMNVHMMEHPAVSANLALLRSRGAIVMEPGSGLLACGYTGKGRLPEPEDIVAVVDAVLHQGAPMKDVHVVVTAGPTIEDIDPVRFLSNPSTGKMGYEIALAAVSRGAKVTLISGPTHLGPVAGAQMVYIRSTEDLLHAVQAAMPRADVLISAAAPADFRPAERLDQKWKKAMGVPSLELVSTPDVLATVAAAKDPRQVLVGFAAETTKALEEGRRKLHRKGLDLVVVNDVSEPEAGFAVDTNRVTLVGHDGFELSLPVQSKARVAHAILDQVQILYSGKRG